MAEHPAGIKAESWLVSAGRASEPGAPLNVPLVPASNFIIGGGREYSRDDGTPTWEALEDLVGVCVGGLGAAVAADGDAVGLIVALDGEPVWVCGCVGVCVCVCVGVCV